MFIFRIDIKGENSIMTNNYLPRESILLQLLKLFGMFIVAYLMVLIIFSTVVPKDIDGGIPEKYGLSITIIAIVLVIAVDVIINYNLIQSLRNQISKTEADIFSVRETSSALISKAERLADKYLLSETGLYEKFAETRKEQPKIKNSSDFKAVMESYPELKANLNTQKLLNQLEVTENANLNAKMTYSSAVARYNSKIHSFPIVIIKKMCKWEDINIQLGISKEELISDEELGI